MKDMYNVLKNKRGFDMASINDQVLRFVEKALGNFGVPILGNIFLCEYRCGEVVQ